MEPRLVDARELHELICEKYSQPKWGHEFTQAAYMIVTELENAPTVEAAPVVHGKWIWADDGYLRCSECQQKAPMVPQYQDEPETVATNYCPNCAAKMDL